MTSVPFCIIYLGNIENTEYVEKEEIIDGFESDDNQIKVDTNTTESYQIR
jgi:hypothetical protein